MNYKHIFHAGNIGDAFKHIVLLGLLQSLQRKDTPFCYLETHAGAGKYDLSSPMAQKNGEFNAGIGKIFTAENPPSLVNDYLACVTQMNPAEKLLVYPGSPFFALSSLRTQDRMVLSELHPEAFQELKSALRHDKRVVIHHQDGYQSLKACLPPKERRGLVLIDPPYENPKELSSLPSILAQALKRWETGIYALWYPIKNRPPVDVFLRELKHQIQKPILITELSVLPEEVQTSLNGSGMVIVNPPWQFDELLQQVVPWLWNALAIEGKGRYCVDLLTKENC